MIEIYETQKFHKTYVANNYGSLLPKMYREKVLFRRSIVTFNYLPQGNFFFSLWEYGEIKPLYDTD